MPQRTRLKLVAPLGFAIALLIPGVAHATLAFTRNPLHPAVFAAEDNGKGVHRVGSGYAPSVSPDGRSVVYFGGGKTPEMKLAPAAGGPTRTLMKGWQEPFRIAFSPDSTKIAAERGAELGKRKLVILNVASGAQRVVARGYFSGFSFSPDGTELAFSKSAQEFSFDNDVFRVASAGGKPVALTHDHRSQTPLWGPTNRIVFDKVHGLKQPNGPTAQLYLMNPDGSGVKRLTHTRIAPLLFGLSPTDWSADGGRLLAEFGGQDTSYAVTVDPHTGREQKVIPGDFEMGFIGAALSRDGSFVLGTTGGEEPGPDHHIALVPYSGGKPKIIVSNGYEPDWSR